MNTNADIASINYLPGCYCSDGRGRRRVDGKGSRDAWEIAPEPPRERVRVYINGRWREAVRWLWLWRIVRWIQFHLFTRRVRLWLLADFYEHKIGSLPAHSHTIRMPKREGEG